MLLIDCLQVRIMRIYTPSSFVDLTGCIFIVSQLVRDRLRLTNDSVEKLDDLGMDRVRSVETK